MESLSLQENGPKSSSLSTWAPREHTRQDLDRNEHTLPRQGAFLLKKTEVSIHSEPAAPFSDEQSSDQASTYSTVQDEIRGRSTRDTISMRHSEEQSSIHSSVWQSSDDLAKAIDPRPFGTTVSIEAAQPVKAHVQKLHEMKGLEQAASVKRWAGDGTAAEVWGKLSKDPELWDKSGDTLAYFGYQRPQPSFRIKASLLENTKSNFLISKLHDGFQRSVKLSPTRDHASRPRRGMRNLNLRAKRHQELPTLSENGNLRDGNQIRNEIHFPAPEEASGVEILRHHITTRNFFASLLGGTLVGLTYYQALADLHERLLLYMPQDVDCAQLIIRYMTRRNLHNVANDPAVAVGLLAWSENSGVRWQEGWREAFVHCVGMYDNLRHLPEVRDVSHGSRMLLERSHIELQARIEACEARLSAFDFDDIWLASAWSSSLPRRAFDRLGQFLKQYYVKTQKGWPPGAYGSNDHWLTRAFVQRLQTDFDSLYDYYVDRYRPWDRAAELRMQAAADGKCFDEASSLTEVFVCLNKRFRWPPIPYPYPLLPATTAELMEGKPLKQNIFSTKAKTMEKRILHACAEASNSLQVGPETTSNGLVEAFIRFEKTDLVSEGNPREVRQGRWILLYGILQILATVSVDTPELWFKDVPYFLNPHFKGNPPWRLEAEKVLEEANPMLSHCWTVSKTWKAED
ncbi:MAG: hypothetical protein Q9171_006409 [Xanthocarpia ochracea]